MPLIETTGISAFSNDHQLHEQPPAFALTLEGGESLFADLPGADSSFSGNSWSAEDDVLDLTPFVRPEPGTSSSDEQAAFNFQPSPELAAMEAVAAAAEQHEQEHEQHQQLFSQPLVLQPLPVEPLVVAPVVPVKPKQAKTTRTTRPQRNKKKKRSASDAFEPEDDAASKPARKSRRTASNARPSRTAAKLAAIKSKTTRAAASKLKRKTANATMGSHALSKTELALAGTLDLSRDELLNMTSDALEAYAQRLAAERPLTAEEQKRFKRQRRLIKNRESAQLSRLRKKAYVDELEKQIAECEEEKERFKKRCETQQKDMDSMRSEITYLRDLLAQHPGLAAMANNAGPAGTGSRRQQRQLLH